jgi:broad specificity phosphatase PhoE
MRIVLMRHGKPKLSKQAWIAAKDFYLWINAYNSAPLCAHHRPSVEALAAANACKIVVCSSLRRSAESAEMLGLKNISAFDPALREMEMPYSSMLSIMLPPMVWAIVFRTRWLFGYSANSESFYEAKMRASQAAFSLMEMAKGNEVVLFIGHGLLNRYIALQLRTSGWEGPKKPASKYWSFSVFEHEAISISH